MQITPLPATGSRPACQLHCQALPVRLTITGLAADELAALLHATARPPLWPPRAGTITIDNPDTPPAPEASAPRTLQVGPDQLQLASGGPARLLPGATSPSPASHFPQGLYLCLAQQWARSGVFALHAAGLVVAGTGVLVLGERMAGKSTLALTTLAAGHQVISDDWLLLGIDADGACMMERLRGYLALRAGPVRDRLLPQARLGAASARTGDRQLFAIQPETPHPAGPGRDGPGDPGGSHFPVSARVSRLWRLSPTTPRPACSHLEPDTAANALAGLVTAAMPLLLSAAFPVERQALMATAGHLLPHVAPARLSAGHDLVQAPAENRERLLKTLVI